MTLRSELDQFGVLFKEHLRGSAKASLRWVTAETVDWDNRTMIATDTDGLAFNGVLLGVGAVAVKPKQGTDCLISIVEGDEASTILIYAHEADLIQYNGGDNGGLVKIEELVEKINRLEESFNSHMHVASSLGSPTTPPVDETMAPALIVPLTGKSDLENIKIKH